MSIEEFRAVLDWFMVSDPWPLSEEAHARVEEMLNREALGHGFGDWIDAFHRLGKTRTGG